MRPEADVYSIDSDDSSDVYSLPTEAGSIQETSNGLRSAWRTRSRPKDVVDAAANDRKSSRNPVPDVRQLCDLKVGAKLLPAILVDESKGGFAITIDCLDGLKAGKRGKLRTDAGWFNVRIVYVTKVSPPTHCDSKSDCWLRVGLRKARSFLLF